MNKGRPEAKTQGETMAALDDPRIGFELQDFIHKRLFLKAPRVAFETQDYQ